MKKFHILFFALLCFLLPNILLAAGLDSGVKRTLSIEVNKGHILTLQHDVSTVFIADPSIVDFHMKAPGVIYLYAKKIGETSLYITNKKGEVVANYQLIVTYNLESLRQLFRSILPRAKISVASAGDSIVLRGQANSIAEAEDAKRLAEKIVGDKAKVVDFVRVNAPTQVNLHVHVVEMDRNIDRALGINWKIDFSKPSTDLFINPSITPTEFVASSGVIPNAVNFGGNLIRGNTNINATIQMLEVNDLVTVLSEPNLTALSGETASFLVGGEFPILIPQGNSTLSVEFKKFGVSLSFRPTILANRRINLQVRPEVSELSTNGAVNFGTTQIPALNTRRTETTVELNSGQSFAIAGLLQNNAERELQQLPGLANIPVLGSLFRSTRFLRKETELVIIVTPYLVEPVGNQDFEMPSDVFNPAQPNSDLETLKKLERGDMGFILE